jgi:hypothetical protein
MLSDFMWVPNSARDIYTKNHYFSNHILFTTISLLQKKRLNPRNYSKKEIIMKLFVWATGNDMNMYAKFQIIFKYRHLWTINLVSEFLEFCTKIYCMKVSLVKPTVKSGSRGCIQNLFCKNKFWTFLQVSTNFWSLKQFLLFKTIRKMIKSPAQGRNRPKATAHRARPGSPAQPSGANGWHGHHARRSSVVCSPELGRQSGDGGQGSGGQNSGAEHAQARGARKWGRGWVRWGGASSSPFHRVGGAAGRPGGGGGVP